MAPEAWADAECVPPHDLSDKPIVLPTGSAASKLIEVMEASRAVLERFDDVAANQVWLWGQGHQPQLPVVPGAPRRRARAWSPPSTWSGGSAC